MNKHLATVARKDLALTGGNRKQVHNSEYRLSAVTGLDLESERERERNVGEGSEKWIVRMIEREMRGLRKRINREVMTGKMTESRKNSMSYC